MQIPVFESDSEFDGWLDDYCLARQLRTADVVTRLVESLQRSGLNHHDKPLYRLLPEIVNSGQFKLPD